MLVLQCHIEIINKDSGNILKFNYCHAISVKTSMGTMTDTAMVKIPKKLKWLGKSLYEDIQIGDKINIFLGYKGKGLNLVFSGYVTLLSNVSPITIECEDEMWKLKNTEVKPKRYAEFDLKAFMGEYVPGMSLDIPEAIRFGEVTIKEEASVAKVIDYLMQNYPFRCFFSGRKLYCVLLNSKIGLEGKEHVLRMGYNTISDTLKYVRGQEVKVIIKAKTIVNNKQKIEVQSPKGATEGEIKTFYAPACKNKKELQDFSDGKLASFRQDSLSGAVTLFGVPFVAKGDKVAIKDEINKERDNKRFMVDSVEYQFGQNGYRQTITLGNRLK